MTEIDEKYINALMDIYKNGNIKGNRTGYKTLSLFNKNITIDKLDNDELPIPTCRKFYFKGALVEMFWILGILQKQEPIENVGRNNIAYLNKHKVYYWDKWADETGELGSVYGQQLCEWNGEINQIQNIVDKIRENPEDRRLVFSMWNPSELNNMALPPCHWGGEFYVYNDENNEQRISLRWIQRSADFPIGVPYNFMMYTILLKMVCIMTNSKMGTLTGLFGDAHIYENQIEGVKRMITNKSYCEKLPQPKLIYTGPTNIEKFEEFKLEHFKIIDYKFVEDFPIDVNV